MPESYDIRFGSWMKLLPKPAVLAGALALSGLSGFIGNAKGAECTVECDPNTEPDLAGYKLHYGLSSRNYDTIIDTGLQLDSAHGGFRILGMPDGALVYIAATAYDTVRNESGYSNEITHTSYNVPRIISATQTFLGTGIRFSFDPGGTDRKSFYVYVAEENQPFAPFSLINYADACSATPCDYTIDGLTSNMRHTIKLVGVLENNDKTGSSNSISIALSSLNIINIDNTAPWAAPNDVPKYSSRDEIILDGFASDNLTGLEVLVTNKQAEFYNQTATLTPREDLGSNNFEYNITVPLVPGYNEITKVFKDASGNTTTLEYLVIQDAISPNLLVTNPQGTDKEAITITGKATDNHSISSLTNQEGQILIIGQNGSFSETISTIEGTNTRTYTLEDKAGNITKTTISFLCALSTPSVSVSAPPISTNPQADVSWRVDHPTYTTLRITKSGNQVFESPAQSGSTQITLADEGENTYGVMVDDGSVGHFATTSFSIIKETSPPEIKDFYSEKVGLFGEKLILEFYDATTTAPSFSQLGSIQTTQPTDGQSGKVIFNPRLRDRLGIPLGVKATLTDSVNNASSLDLILSEIEYNPNVQMRNDEGIDVLRRLIMDGEDYNTQEEVADVWGDNVNLVRYDGLSVSEKSKILGDQNLSEGEKALSFDINNLSPGASLTYSAALNTRIVKDENVFGGAYNTANVPVSMEMRFHIADSLRYLSEKFIFSPGWNPIDAKFWNKKYYDCSSLNIDGISIIFTNTNPSTITGISEGIILDSIGAYKPAGASHLELID